MSEIDAAELARLQQIVRFDSFSVFTDNFPRSTVLALLDALEKARGERDQFAEQLALRSESGMRADMQEIMRINNGLITERDSSRALLRDVTTWAQQRCPCDNDGPKICPLCDADVATDRCMAVDVSFPRTIRARIDKELGQ